MVLSNPVNERGIMIHCGPTLVATANAIRSLMALIFSVLRWCATVRFCATAVCLAVVEEEPVSVLCTCGCCNWTGKDFMYFSAAPVCSGGRLTATHMFRAILRIYVSMSLRSVNTPTILSHQMLAFQSPSSLRSNGHSLYCNLMSSIFIRATDIQTCYYSESVMDTLRVS